MAWQYRKRVKVAPGIYMNISKNGISTSVGVRGASITFGKNGTYLNTGIPGTGFYNRQRIGDSSTPRVGYSAHPKSTPKIHSKGTYTTTAWLCGLAALACMAAAPVGLIGTFIFGCGMWANFSNRKKFYGKNAGAVADSPTFIADAKKALAESTDPRQKRILSNFITTVETVDAIEDEEHILESLNKKPAKNAEFISTHTAELASLKHRLESTKYDVDESVTADVMTLYEKLCQSFEQLLTSQKIWEQTSKMQNMEAKSSAGSLVNLKETNFGVGVFNYIKSKFDVPIIPVGNQLLYLYPEYTVLSTSPSHFEVIDYTNISMIYSPIRFNEPGFYPTDAEKIGTTWEYVNKNGSPDKRYANNRQIAIVRYGGINLTIKGKMTVTFQVSNANLADDFCTCFNKLAGTVRANTKETVADMTEQDSLSAPSVPTSPVVENKFSLSEVIQAADKLFYSLVDMTTDRQIVEALDNQKQLEKALDLSQIGGGIIDKRLVVVALTDIVKCFDRLGHRPNMMTDEGRSIGIVMSRIIFPDNEFWNNLSSMQSAKGQKFLSDCYNLVKDNFHIDFKPDKFLLIEMLHHEGVDEETINKWAVLLYRYALLIAKADGFLSDSEQKWLTNILSFTKNGEVDTTNYNTTSKKVTLPQCLDPLFADCARQVVTAGTASTSTIQRLFEIGYNRAGRIMDQLEMVGIVGPANGGKPREVLLDSLTLDELLSTGSSTIDMVEEVPSSIAVEEPTAKPKKVQCKNISNPMKELENLIGLAGVKTEVTNIYHLVKVQKVRASKGLSVPDISYHCVFTGNPGTGKTTVARLVAQIYKKLGILTKGHLVETDRSGLVAEYVGQTAVKTNKIIDSALDGVLFIVEAYSLVQNGGGNDYGHEAIATLLKRMEDNRDRLVVILAGYSDEMKQFIDSNPGLQSRFNRYIHFEDYSADEMTSIYEFNLSKFDYKMTTDTQKAIKEVMTEAVANKDKNFGNARFVRNLFEKTLERQAKRLASSTLSSLTEEALTEITAADIK